MKGQNQIIPQRSKAEMYMSNRPTKIIKSNLYPWQHLKMHETYCIKRYSNLEKGKDWTYFDTIL